jgi:hypothetical protein
MYNKLCQEALQQKLLHTSVHMHEKKQLQEEAEFLVWTLRLQWFCPWLIHDFASSVIHSVTEAKARGSNEREGKHE